MKYFVEIFTLAVVLGLGFFSPSSYKSFDQVARNEARVSERNIEMLSEKARPSLGSAEIQNPMDIQNALLKQKIVPPSLSTF